MARNKSNNSRSRSVDPKDLEKIAEYQRTRGGRGKAVKSRDNDWQWYALNEQLLKDSASYPFTYPLGNPIPYGSAGLDANKWAIPGICAIEVSPTPGYADDPNAPVNISARKQFSDIRKANSGSANYDSPDLMLYYLAVDSMFMMLSFFKRAYGVMLTYNPVNRYAPKAIIQSMGLDFDDIAANLADYRAMLNTFIIKTSSMSIPRDMSYMAKHRWMFEGIYKDQDINKAQLYMFVPHGYYIYGLDSDGAGMLNWKRYNPYYSTPLKVSDIEVLLASIIDPILYGVGAQDFNIMSGDIIKAYGRENCLTMEQVATEYAILPEYSEEVLDQIQNATLIGALPETGHNELPSGQIQDIVQDTTKTYLKYTPLFYNRVPFSGNPSRPSTVTAVAGDNCFVTNRIVTFDRDVVLPEHTMVATRLTNIASQVTLVTGKYAHLIKCDTLGSEVANQAHIWRYELDSNGVMKLVSKRWFDISWTFLNIISNYSTTNVGSVATAIQDMYDDMHQLMTELSYFHRHMPVAITAGLVDESTGNWNFDSFNGYFFDVNSYTVLNRDDLKQMAEAALLSEFDVTIKTLSLRLRP